MNIFHKLTGGRPMRLFTPCFLDELRGEMVSLYQDRAGRFWLASGPWASFRVPENMPEMWLTEPDCSPFRFAEKKAVDKVLDEIERVSQ